MDPEYITIETVCAIIGGDKPVHYSTYYRGVKAGRLPAPEHPTPGVSRVRKQKLLDALNRGEGA